MAQWPTPPVDWSARRVKTYVQPGQLLCFPRAGDVTVFDWLGGGSFGQVFHCVSALDPDALCAVKVAPLNAPGQSRQMRNEIRVYEFIDEHFGAAARDGCGRLFDYMQVGRFLFMLMERYESSLVDVIGSDGLSLVHIQHFLRLLLPPLHEFWELGMIHTDIKPENIMVTADSRLKLIDFGGTAFRGDQLGFYIQSRWYRAPELLFSQTPTTAIDIWSVGAVLAEMWLGAPLFRGESSAECLELMEIRLGPLPNTLTRGLAPATDIDEFIRPMKLEVLIMAKEFPGEPPGRREFFIDLLRRMLESEPAQRIIPS
jgi:serine/threonine protein kinase